MKVKSIPLSQIIILPRVRGEEHLQNHAFVELKLDIETTGLLQPIVINEKFELLAGFRRYNACLQLGHKRIPCNVVDANSEVEMLLIELLENKDREDFTWQEDVQARGKLFELASKKNKITIEIFSDVFLHQTKSQTSKDLTVYKYGLTNPNIYKIISKRLAYEKITRERATEVTAALIKAEESLPGKQLAPLPTVYNTAEELLLALPPHSVDLCATDPPYGIKVERSGGKGIFHSTRYDDNWDKCSDLLNTVIKELGRVMKPGAHVYFFCDFRYAHLTQEIFKTFGFGVCPTPIIWVKLGLKIASNAHYYAMRQHEYCIQAFAPGEMVKLAKTGKSDVILSPVVPHGDRTHPLEKPVGLYDDLIERSGRTGDVFIDPFMGTGNSLLAARERGLVCHGAEIEQEYRDIAKVKFKEEL